MKRIYMTLAFLSAIVFGAQAQNVDLEGVAAIYPGARFYESANLTPTLADSLGDADSVFGIWGVYVNAPEGILTGDEFGVVTSFNKWVQPGDEGFTDTAKFYYYSLYTASADVDTGSYAVGPFSYDSISRIGLLMDWAEWNDNDSVVFRGPPYEEFENNKEYGFFVRPFEVTGGTDPNPNNNRAVVRIVWNPLLSIKDMIAPVKRMNLNVYPNPSSSDLTFKFDFEKNGHASVIVRDLTGRVVLAKNYGKVTQGEKSYTIDISKLIPGNYSVELNGDYTSAVAKFTKI